MFLSLELPGKLLEQAASSLFSPGPGAWGTLASQPDDLRQRPVGWGSRQDRAGWVDAWRGSRKPTVPYCLQATALPRARPHVGLN